jgi:N-acetyl-anhydromuramyl-L-alanine amidase AmpD
VSYILSRGFEVECEAPVRATRDFKFQALGRRAETRAVVLHWTGGRRGAAGVFETLRERGLSVHFVVEADGTVWQFADCDRRCSHAGPANGWSIGIEIVNPAGATLSAKDSADGRTVAECSIRGRRVRHASFTAAQTRSALALTRAVCAAWGLPFRARAGEGTATARELADFRGVLGHYEISDQKTDPGRGILDLVNEAGP